MVRYLLIESRDPQEGSAVADYADLARDLRGAGNEVTLFLVQNGVFAARKGFAGSRVGQVGGAAVLADGFSLRQRGIDAAEVAPGVKVSEIGDLVDLLVQPDVRAMWH